MALDESTGPVGGEASKKLYDSSIMDPYIKELSSTIFSRPEAILTYGMAKHQRDVLLDLHLSSLVKFILSFDFGSDYGLLVPSSFYLLFSSDPRQPTAGRVAAMVEDRLTAMSALKKIADCLIQETNTWKSSMVAILKAKQLEEKAEQKAQTAATKKEEKERQKAMKAAAKEAAKLAAAERAKGENENENEEDDNRKRRERRRKVGGQDELQPHDPQVLREMATFQVGNMPFFEDVDAWALALSGDPTAPCAARLKKASFRKVLIETGLSRE